MIRAMNETFKKSVRRLAYNVNYFASLCRWLADSLTSIPEYKPEEGKSVNYNFQNPEETGT